MEGTIRYYKVKSLLKEPFHMKFTGEHEYDFNPDEEVIVPEIVAQLVKERWQGVLDVVGEITEEDIHKASLKTRKNKKSQEEPEESEK